MTETAPSAPLVSGTTDLAQEPREGSPVWIDLSVPDVAADQDFYRQLFGWSFRDLEAGDGYHVIEREGGAVVGGARSTGDQPSVQHNGQHDDGRPIWTVYLASDDLQETMTTVEAAAGKVLTAPTPVGEVGARAVAISPAGDRVGWWQSYGGAEALATDLSRPGHGAPVWFELMSLNYDTHLSFYRQVSGWEPAPWQGDHLSARYTTDFPGEQATAGMLEATNYLPTGTISYWRVYIGVDDLEAAVQKAQELGGTVLAGPVDSPHGRMAVVRDPQGAGFPIVQLPA